MQSQIACLEFGSCGKAPGLSGKRRSLRKRRFYGLMAVCRLAGAELAETRFGVPASAGSQFSGQAGLHSVEAEPITGRTHQIRVHAAESGFPILGDTLYGGTPATRVYLHAAELAFRHPAS